MSIDTDLKIKIANANRANPYVDITPYELKMGFPSVSYNGFFPQPDEILIYVAPAQTFSDKEKVVGYTGKSAGVSVRIAKGVSVRTGGSGGKAIRNNVRMFNQGDLIITNKRVLFIGKDDRFEFLVNKISTTKLLDRTSFVIQSGKSSKNVALDESLVAYAYGFINYVVNQTNQGVDTYNAILEGQKQLTTEQISICNQVREESMNLKVNSGNGKKKSKSWFKVLLIVIIIGIFIGVLSNLNSDSTGKGAASSTGIETVAYTDTQLLTFEKHPKIYDNFEESKSFYDSIGSDKVKVVDIPKYSSLQKKLKSFTDDEVILYFVKLPDSSEKIGEVHINLFSPELYTDMSVEKAVELIVDYLPVDFLKYYKQDSSYQHGNEDTTFYTYSCRLNEEGVEYHNNGNGHYSYYYYFRITHYKDTNQWSITTGYSAYGGKGLDWIRKYSEPWEIDLNDYITDN